MLVEKNLSLETESKLNLSIIGDFAKLSEMIFALSQMVELQ